MSEVTVPMDDKALFDAATAPEAPQTAEAPAQETVAEQLKPEDEQPRDEHGRFAPKAEDVEQAPAQAGAEQPKPVVQTPAPAEAKHEPPPGWIPAWRAREMVEAERRKLEKPPEPIDPYVDPQKFRDQGIAEATAPLEQRLASTREYYSRMFAEQKHGEQTVKDAYGWLEQALSKGDPKAEPILQRSMNSIDPFGEIVTAFKRDRALSTVGDDPNAWFEKEFERRAASDPAFKEKLAALQGGQQQNGATPNAPATNVVKLPPSLNRTSGAQAPAAGGMSDADLYAFAKG